jgi:hypothetical protein
VFRFEGGLRGEIKVVQGPYPGELGQAGRHVQPPLFTAGDLGLTKERQGLAQVQVSSRGVIEQSVQLIAQRGQLETPQ